MVCLECRLGSQHIDDRCIGALSFSARSLALVLSLRVVRAFLSEKLGTLGVRHGGLVLLSEKLGGTISSVRSLLIEKLEAWRHVPS